MAMDFIETFSLLLRKDFMLDYSGLRLLACCLVSQSCRKQLRLSAEGSFLCVFPEREYTLEKKHLNGVFFSKYKHTGLKLLKYNATSYAKDGWDAFAATCHG